MSGQLLQNIQFKKNKFPEASTQAVRVSPKFTQGKGADIPN